MNNTKNSRKEISLSINDITKFLKEKYYFVILIGIFIFSFALDISVLTRYPLSYGIDGAFYDIQVRNILQYGFPMSNDPPLAYYLQTPFVLLFGNSFLGVKIGMALMGSLLAFPTFLLTECYIRKEKGKRIGSKIPALLGSFMITVNVNYFALLGDFMQNLIGVLFLSIFLYFAIRWFEDTSEWKKYGVLTALFLFINLLTHIYTGALAVTLFFALLIFNIVLKTYKTRKLPLFDLKILCLFGALALILLAILFLAYPVTYTKYNTVLSFFNASSTVMEGRSMSSPVSGIIFCSLPYLLGVASAFVILYRGLKQRSSNADSPLINRNTLLSWAYIALTAVLVILIIIPSSQYQSRFLLMAFLPIGLIVPLGLKFLETEFLTRYPSKKQATTILVAMIAIIFAFSSYYTASESFNNLGPTITTDEYNELLAMKENFSNVKNQNIVILASDFQTKYWVEYALKDVGNGNNITVIENIQGIQDKYQNTTIYSVSTQNNQTSSLSSPGKSSGTSPSNQSNMGGGGMGGLPGSGGSNNYALSFLLPYGPPILPNSMDTIFAGNGGSKMDQMNNGKQHLGNMTNNTNKPPGNMTLASGPDVNLTNNMQPPGNMTNSTNPPQGAPGNGMGSSSDGDSMKIIETLTSSGTTIYNGKYFKIIRINVKL